MNYRLKSETQTLRRVGIFFCAICFAATVRAQLPSFSQPAARSVSGQFSVFAAPRISAWAGLPSVVTNTEYVRLEPALLAITAERIKRSLSEQLGDNSQWRGRIFFSPRPAQSLDENVTVVASRFDNTWNYRIELPDVLSRARLTRAIVGAALLEFGNRNAGERSAEIPAWLMDGLSERVLAANTDGFILSAPTHFANGVVERRLADDKSGWYPLGNVHRILRDQSALTFAQLSWPTDAQLAGKDGGVYRASAQLFVHDLLESKNGARELRAMLQLLPRYYNWQLAFREAFKRDFPSQIELEKWWALQTVNFAALNVGPMWTADTSGAKLDEILSVPVDYRSASNNLPVHAETSLQDAIRNFDSENRVSLLQIKARDLQIAELRMSPQFAELTAQYVQTISDYLGQRPAQRKILFGRRSDAAPSKPDMEKTLKTLDNLDARRRNVETALDQPKSPSRLPALTERNSNL
jgi:hypothetical protein